MAEADNGQLKSPRLYDAHNHLQDERLKSAGETLFTLLQRENVCGLVVNGSAEEDWPAVLSLAQRHPQVIPSFGYHPWYVKERSERWQQVLTDYLNQVPSAIGEIGLDRWIKDHDSAQQEEVFVWQLRLAAERNLPVSIHCLQAWGKLFDLLRANPRPECGFVLHSFGGPQEMVEPLAKLGAYFSLPGYFAHERKQRQRDAFRCVPPDRLLIETDAPDQSLPPERVQYPLTDPDSGQPINHPANLAAVYRFAAELFQEPLESLAARVEENIQRLFGGVMRTSKPTSVTYPAVS
ncbi:MAG TPA: TatD family hydrolase [Clostridia bacterium]|nr:TatD family hydrolase [Clostridia bacterium]